MISFTRIDLARLGLETMGLDRQFIFRALLDSNSKFTLSIGNGFPAEFPLVRSPDANPRTGQSKTLLGKYTGEYDEVVSVRAALLFVAGGHAWNRTRRQDKE